MNDIIKLDFKHGPNHWPTAKGAVQQFLGAKVTATGVRAFFKVLTPDPTLTVPDCVLYVQSAGDTKQPELGNMLWSAPDMTVFIFGGTCIA